MTLTDWSVVRRPFGRTTDPALWAAWSALARAAAPHLRPEFLALARGLGGDGEPFVMAAYQGGELAGVLPLVRRGRTLFSPRSEHAPEFDLVGQPESVEPIWRALAGERDWDQLVLQDVPAGSPLAVRLPGAALRDLTVCATRPASRSPWFALPGFEERLAAKHRQNMRRLARKLGPTELERVTRFSHAALEEGLALEAMAWKAEAGTAIRSSAPVRRFYQALARLSARRGELSLCFLRAGGRRIAFLFALEDGRVLYALKVGYDPAFAGFSPGHLLFLEVARDAERRGLLELDFMGQEDEWKRRWTRLGRDHLVLTAYRPTARGAAGLVAREIVRPRLPAGLLAVARRARAERADRRRRCQRSDLVGVHSLAARAADRVRSLGLRGSLRRVLRAPPVERPPLGAPSRFEPGQWVRVLDAERMRAALDGDDRLRGLKFVQAQWSTCGQVHEVDRSVRRLVDDRGRLRAVGRTALLNDVTCDAGGDQLGCGRHCPLMFRDEWLEPAAPPGRAAATAAPTWWASVRPVDEIHATLDRHGRRDGITFMPEMKRFAGRRLPVVRLLPRVFELDRWTPTRAPIYLLAGANCSGAVLGDLGPCDRACSLLWHGEWLVLRPALGEQQGRTVARAVEDSVVGSSGSVGLSEVDATSLPRR